MYAINYSNRRMSNPFGSMKNKHMTLKQKIPSTVDNTQMDKQTIYSRQKRYPSLQIMLYNWKKNNKEEEDK
uniref:Uncharacterized protein n=1 Tax=Rhizophora mucronata TaxID=61149 RepID=A0A2P2NJL9_RHIMU